MDNFASCVKIVSKNASDDIIAKQLISNLFLVAYKLFLYKIRIKYGLEAHKDDGSIAIRVGGDHKFGHYDKKAGRQKRTNYYQKYQ